MFDPKWSEKRDRKSFLCFAGNGFICKGVDILVDAFVNMPDAILHICGPDTEKTFFEVMGDTIKKSENIHYEGFVDIGGEKFNRLIEKCSYVVFASSSEGCATSVTTVLRAGLVPILTPETSIDIGDFGYLIDGPKDNLIAKTIHRCREVMALDDASYASKVWGVLKDSMKYTQGSFSKTIESALITVLEEKDIGSKN
jgi:glycosyltransferase involved in cell wall biosynthesis